MQVVERHGTEIIGMELPEPECAQCIVTTGKRFSFIGFYHRYMRRNITSHIYGSIVNTLDMADVNDGRVKNLVYAERPGF